MVYDLKQKIEKLKEAKKEIKSGILEVGKRVSMSDSVQGRVTNGQSEVENSTDIDYEKKIDWDKLTVMKEKFPEAYTSKLEVLLIGKDQEL